MRVTIVGLGSIGQRHLRNLRALGINDLVAVRTHKRPLADPALLEGVEVFANLKDSLRCRPTAVVVANPPSLHISSAVEAAQHGCHIFIEKPVSSSLDGIDNLSHIVSVQGTVAFVGYQLRFHPGLRLVREFLNEGKIGRVISVRVDVGQYLPDWHPWEDYRKGYSARPELGGGVILDLSHEIDYIYWLFGHARQVFCLGGKHSSLEIGTEDVAEILLACERCPVVEIHLDYVQRVPSRTCQIIGEEGTIRWDYYANRVEVHMARSDKAEIYVQDSFERNQMYVNEMVHFLNCIAGNEIPCVTLADAQATLEIALAARQSSEDGRVQVLAKREEWKL